MARVVLDPGVIVSGLLNPDGPPGHLLDAWVDGEFNLVVSPHLLEELSDVLLRPKLASRLDNTVVSDMLRLLREAAVMESDGPPAQVCRDPDDDYLVALALATGSLLVSGDKDLLSVQVEHLEVLVPAEAAARLLPT
ncbi:MAG TPA: putative toxin-antitoxin system toxin component, PIN family [Acidimicrobiales bacterium]|nr:putative toxin-antitoxin system toxin component, PIN family [Acidimicrobiales bacterium]